DAVIAEDPWRVESYCDAPAGVRRGTAGEGTIIGDDVVESPTVDEPYRVADVDRQRVRRKGERPCRAGSHEVLGGQARGGDHQREPQKPSHPSIRSHVFPLPEVCATQFSQRYRGDSLESDGSSKSRREPGPGIRRIRFRKQQGAP